MSFLTNANRWERREFSEWLAQYHELAEWSDRTSEPPSSSRRRTPVSTEHLRDWAAEAFCQVLARLDTVQTPEGAHRFGVLAIQAGLVVPTCDDEGRCGFAPQGKRRMDLAERVLSLLAADYLTRPEEYCERLKRCGGCRRFMFVDRGLIGKAQPRCRHCARAPTLRWRDAVLGPPADRPENDQGGLRESAIARRTA